MTDHYIPMSPAATRIRLQTLGMSEAASIAASVLVELYEHCEGPLFPMEVTSYDGSVHEISICCRIKKKDRTAELPVRARKQKGEA